jgi:peptidoglycan/LPS O-acetylase OafA/YrhL
LFGFFFYWWLGAAAVNPSIQMHLRRLWPYFVIAYLILTVVMLYLVPGVIRDVPYLLQDYSPQDVPTVAFVLAEIRKITLAVLVAVLINFLETTTIRTHNPLASLGRASYSLYALHTPLTFLMLSSGVSWYLTIAGNLAAAFASRLLIERPGLALGKAILTTPLLTEQDGYRSRAPTRP